MVLAGAGAGDGASELDLDGVGEVVDEADEGSSLIFIL